MKVMKINKGVIVLSRKESVKYAMHSMELEGYVYTEAEKELFDRLAKGEIEPEDIRKFADEELARLKREKPEVFVKEN